MLQFLASANGTRNIEGGGETLLEGGGPYLRERNLFSPEPSIDPSEYYIPGAGRPSISTSDHYHSDGIAGFRCYDLLTMGSHGAAIATARGRFVWLTSSDHCDINWSWLDGCNFSVGFSNDPGIPPDVMRTLISYKTTVVVPHAGGGSRTFFFYHIPWLVYDPDAAGDKFIIYGTGATLTHTAPANPISLAMGYATTSDFVTATMTGLSHDTTTFGGRTAYQRIVRNGTGDWISVGMIAPNAAVAGLAAVDSAGKYTSTDGRVFTYTSGQVTNSSIWGYASSLQGQAAPITISGQRYSLLYAADAFDTSNVILAPIDSNYNILSTPSTITLSEDFGNYNVYYPGPKYMQWVNGYDAAADGILHVWAIRGFPVSTSQQRMPDNTPLVDGAPYNMGGALWHQFADYYTYTYNSTLAAVAAPIGVRASCAAGVVTLTWHDALPQNTYRIYRGTTSATQATLVGNVTGVTTTDTPTPNAQYWYKVVTISSSAEQGTRVVDVYVSAHTEFVNKHVLRVINDGGDFSTINMTHLAAADALLTANDWHDHLLWWPDPAFGVKYQAGLSPLIEVVYCLGTTRVPLRGDYRPISNAGAAGTTTYSATGLNSTAPAWVNPNATSFGYFGNGRINNLRRLVEITCLACYSKPNTNFATLLSIGEFTGMQLYHNSGSSGTAAFSMAAGSGSPMPQITSSKTLTGQTSPHVIAGTYDDDELITYVDGVGGTPVTGLVSNRTLQHPGLLHGQFTSQTTAWFLGSGSFYCKMTPPHNFTNNNGQFSCAGIAIFDKAFSSAEIGVLTEFYHDWIGI